MRMKLSFCKRRKDNFKEILLIILYMPRWELRVKCLSAFLCFDGFGYQDRTSREMTEM